MRLRLPKLIPEWKLSWRMFSMQSIGAAVGLNTSWMMLGDDLKAAIPAQYVMVVAIIILLLGGVGRIIDQSIKIKEGENDEEATTGAA